MFRKNLTHDIFFKIHMKLKKRTCDFMAWPLSSLPYTLKFAYLSWLLFLYYWLHVYFYIHLMLLYVARTFVSLYLFIFCIVAWIGWPIVGIESNINFLIYHLVFKKNDLATHEISKCLTTLPSLYIQHVLCNSMNNNIF